MTGLDAVRAVADAVLYEGYLLYPYRATSAKNQLRWQFGVFGPHGRRRGGDRRGLPAADAVRCCARPVPLTVHLRFLQLQQRRTERFEGEGFVDGPELRIDGRRWFAWDEAIEIERSSPAGARRGHLEPLSPKPARRSRSYARPRAA